MSNWRSKKKMNGEVIHFPVDYARSKKRVTMKDLALKEKEKKISNEEFKAIEKISADGDSIMDAFTKILFGKNKDILMDSELIGNRFIVNHKKVENLTDIEKAGHGSFVWVTQKNRKRYALMGIATKNGNKWHINAELDEYRVK
jgi:hypothetical protein